MAVLLRKNIGLIAILALTLLPVIFWTVTSPLNFRFADLYAAATSFGQIAGLCGMTLFSVNLILSSRLRILDRLFIGLPNVYDLHQRIGAIAFSLLLFHPLFLAVTYIQVSLRSAALFFIPHPFDAVSFGIAAIFLMIVLLVLTFYAKIRYHFWKFSHKFLVAVFIFAVLHAFFISSDISRSAALRFYIFGLAALGLAGGFYRAFLADFWHRYYRYKVKSIVVLNPAVVEITAEPANGPIGFKPGQFVFVSFRGGGISPESHPFSIASAPGESTLRFVIKSLGDFTATLSGLTPGAFVLLEGPFGGFTHENIPNHNQIWIAGGVGITPFLSMARSLEGGDYHIDLYYCTSNKEEAVLLDELSYEASNNNNFRVIPWYSGEKGYITGRVISEMSGGLAGKDILLCGPPSFMKNLKAQFSKLKVKNDNIHWELFKFL